MQMKIVSPSQILFLPGAAGDPNFWTPVARLIPSSARKTLFGYPWFGQSQPDKSTIAFEDLLAHVVGQINCPTALVAQSMGGVLAIMAAIQQASYVTHLILVATSGGLSVQHHGGIDWRPDFKRKNPSAPEWITSFQHDLSEEIRSIEVPTLLIWGDQDSISPISVGERLATSMLNSTLRVIHGGDHDLARVFPDMTAKLIGAHLLGRGPASSTL